MLLPKGKIVCQYFKTPGKAGTNKKSRPGFTLNGFEYS